MFWSSFAQNLTDSLKLQKEYILDLTMITNFTLQVLSLLSIRKLSKTTKNNNWLNIIEELRYKKKEKFNFRNHERQTLFVRSVKQSIHTILNTF